MNSLQVSELSLPRMMQQNDPSLTELHIYSIHVMFWEEEILGQVEGNVYAPSINCESLGEAIGANTHVKTLIFNGDMWLAALDNQVLLAGVKQNASLQNLCFKSCNISDNLIEHCGLSY